MNLKDYLKIQETKLEQAKQRQDVYIAKAREVVETGNTVFIKDGSDYSKRNSVSVWFDEPIIIRAELEGL